MLTAGKGEAATEFAEQVPQPVGGRALERTLERGLGDTEELERVETPQERLGQVGLWGGRVRSRLVMA